ncbi:MFS transporter [Gaiella sp.]|jgi:MFS family permease|uniref:MFS transporter n=1 Tax=Gaiella sp. TaxID=2663207 RepID=UPI002E357370|nr:MFS transporter [Gaiella sp.]HEX5582818.1 MFS transporter [Gaiella sp.]
MSSAAATSERGTATDVIETDIPGRLDRLPWSRFHWLVVIGLGTVWILDGLEVTIVGSIASRLTEKGSGIELSTGSIGTAAAVYVAGACIGALFFGQLTDRLGRKKLFIITLGVYLLATFATAFAWTAWYFFLCRFVTGAGIGGEYAAINSAIDELIPARVRGRVDLIINGSYWVGSAAGAAAALFFLSSVFPKDIGWRITFALGAVLALTIMLVRRNVPESPRWLFIHGREEEAERIVRDIEQGVEEDGEQLDEVDDTIKVRQRESIPFRTIGRTAIKLYPKRTVLGIALFVGQAFLYNGLTFNLGTLFTTFYGVSSSFVPVFIIVFAIGNFMGPLLLGRLFDTVGRIPMISLSYLGSAAVAVVMALLFANQSLSSPWAFEAFIFATFFLASAGASAAYLTVSEIFPMETRALAIAFFYAIGTGLGGIVGPILFGQMIGTNDRTWVMVAFLIGAGVMSLGGIAELFLGVKAEQTQLEDIAKPLTAEEAEEGGEPGEEKPEESDVRRRAREEQEARERRWRERTERRSARERVGRRRYRPGPATGGSFYSPGMLGTSLRSRQPSQGILDREIDAIARVLEDEDGPLRREEIARRVGARRWGPGRFREALDAASIEERIRRLSRTTYAPA